MTEDGADVDDGPPGGCDERGEGLADSHDAKEVDLERNAGGIKAGFREGGNLL